MIKNVIVETDIGDDIDDTWALIYILSKPDFNVVLIAVTTGDTDYKALLVAGILKTLGREDVPIVKGKCKKVLGTQGPQQRWLAKIDFSSYGGKIYDDYNQQMLNVFNSFPSLDIFLLGPTNDFSSFVETNLPLCKEKAHVLMMGGSVCQGYINVHKHCPEYNVLVSIEATNKLFRFGIDLTLLPLDVCYNLIVDGGFYAQITQSQSLKAQAIMENYAIWQTDYVGGALKYDASVSSSILYDLVVPFFALFPKHYEMMHLSVSIDANGNTILDDSYPLTKVALKVKKQKELLQDLVESIT